MSTTVPAGSPAGLGRWIPRPEGLPEQDWQARHALLIRMLAALPPLELGLALIRGRTGGAVLVWTGLVALGCVVAVAVGERRVASSAVAVGTIAGCAGLVQVFDGLTEARFSSFVAVAALALYRAWTPFLIFLLGTVLHQALAGPLLGLTPYDHHDAVQHPFRWAVVQGGFLLAVAALHVLTWRVAEAEQQRAARRLSYAERQFTVAFEDAPVAIVLSDPDGVIIRANRSLTRIMQAESDQAALEQFGRFFEGRDVAGFVARLSRHELDVGQVELARELDDGTRQFLDVRAGAVRDAAGQLRNILVHVSDVTQSRTHQETLHRQFREDPLTRLLSRPAFEADVLAMLAARGSASLILFDISRFSVLNDTYGREAGDSLLRQLGDRLASLAPPSSLLSRISGDQFAIAVPWSQVQAQALAASIVQASARPFDVAGGTIELAVIAGVSCAAGVIEVEHALSGAEAAAGRAKELGTAVQVYDEELREATQRRIAAEAMLRDALCGDRVARLPVWFQPIVSLDGGRLIGAEALVRMRADGCDLVQPSEFIPIAEETGLVVAVGDHVLQQAVRHLVRWQDRLSYISVNVSPRQLAASDFVTMLARRLRESGLADPSRLVLEITETSLLTNTVEVRQRLEAIKALGVRIALDDFGTGYSSLTWLQQVPADIVKLDRSFVAGLAEDPSKSSIISAVVWLARSLDMTVVAEGVENTADAEALIHSECHTAQGFLFAEPQCPADFERLLAAGVLGPEALSEAV